MSIKFFVIIEDKKEEQEKAIEAIANTLANGEQPERSTVGPRAIFKEAKILVSLASNLKEARTWLSFVAKLNETGSVTPLVLTDLMFPAKEGSREEPNGLGVITTCIELSLPVVVCSDTDHHDVNYLKDVFPVLGTAHPTGEIPVILDNKDWVRAVREMFRLVDVP